MFDLEAYLRRIGHSGPRIPDLDTLRRLCALHAAAIPYENISPLLGTPPSIALADVMDKLVAGGRGGYCFEQNLLLWQALAALGYEVEALAARVVWMRPADAPPRPRTHMLLKVEVREGEHTGAYVADVGFGGNVMDAPLRLEADTPQRTPHALLCYTHEGDHYTAETHLPAGWAPMYRFTLAPHAPADYEPLNWYTATHPTSMFRHNLLMERVTPELRCSLLNDRLVLRTPRLPPSMRRLRTCDELATVLRERFVITLAPDELGALWARIPKGLDQFVTPAA